MLHILAYIKSPLGVIQRQAIKNTSINFVGVLLGAVNVMVVYEQFLTVEEYGKFRYIITTALMLSPFILLGSTNLMVRFFPKFEARNLKNNELLGIGILALMAGATIFYLFTWLGWAFLGDKLRESYYTIFCLMILMACSALFTAYLANFKRIAIPAIFNNIVIKVGVPLAVVLYFYQVISFLGFERGILLTYAIGFIGLLIYSSKIIGKLRPVSSQVITKDLRNDMSIYAIFAMLGGLGTTLATQLDIFMLSEILDFETSGIYAMALFLGTFLVIPLTAVNSIASPVISQAREEDDDFSIFKIYRQSSIHLLIFGLFLALLIWVNIDSIFDLMSKSEIYRQGKYVVLIIICAKLIDMATSVNSQVIAHSIYFRFNFYAIILLAVVNVVNNYIFIHYFDMIGAAYATFLSITLFNLAKLIFIWYKFKMQPFTWNTLKLLAIAMIVYSLYHLIFPVISQPFLAIMVSSLFITVLYGLSVYFLKISTNLNAKIITFALEQKKKYL